MPKEKSARTNKEKSPIRKPKMTEDERLWVIALQDALRQSKEDFGMFSDFDVALHAIIAKDQPAKALQRLRRLKKFKEAYKVRDDSTVYEAIKSMHDFVHAYPDFIQACGKDTAGRWVCFFQLEPLTRPTMSIEKRLSAVYYIFHALQPDLDAVRMGTVWVGDFQGVTRQNLSLGIVNGGRSLCRDSYPIKVKDLPCINSPPRLSAVYAMCRPFLSQRLFERMVMDCTPQVIQKHFPKRLLCKSLGGTQGPTEIMDMLEENLKTRFENQESFRLNLLGLH